MANALTSFKEVKNLGFDIKKTEELVAGLKKDGVVVGIEDLSSYIRKQGLIVQEHVGRKRTFSNASAKMFGVDLSKKGEECNEFFKKYVKTGKVSFLSDDYEKKLINIESAVRMQRQRNSIGYDSKFMTLDSYNDFVAFVERKRKEYFEVRDEIVENWDTITTHFKEILQKALDEVSSIDKETVINAILSRLPSKAEYAQSFYMTISAKAFPVTENLEMFSEDIQEQIKEGLNQETISTLYEIVGDTLNDAFGNVCKVINTIQKNDKVAVKTLDSIKRTAVRIGQKNIFNNAKIEKIRTSIIDMLDTSIDPGIMAEEAEIIISMIYGYAVELDIRDSIDLKLSPFSESELLETFEMLGGVVEEVNKATKTGLAKMRA